MIDESIKRLDTWLKTNRPEYYAGLGPGATKAQIQACEEQLGRTFPDSLKAFYAWKNGDSGPGAFQYNRYLMTLKDIVTTCQTLDPMIGGDFEEKNWWSAKWIPFLANGGGDHICVDTEGTFTANAGQIIHFWHDWESRNIAYPTLDMWLQCFVETLEMGLWHIGQGGNFAPIDEDKVHSIDSHFCPGYPRNYEATDDDDDQNEDDIDDLDDDDNEIDEPEDEPPKNKTATKKAGPKKVGKKPSANKSTKKKAAAKKQVSKKGAAKSVTKNASPTKARPKPAKKKSAARTKTATLKKVAKKQLAKQEVDSKNPAKKKSTKKTTKKRR